MASAYLSRTQGTATLDTKYTFSCWIKRSKITDRQQFIRTTGYGYFEFQADDKLHYYDVATGGDLVTNKVFRDTNAWYHIVLSVDTTLATADDRHKIYINGVQETSFSGRTNPTQNNGGYFFDDGRVMYIGSNEGSNLFFNGCISHLHGIDGTAYDASTFGESDSNGVWIPKFSPSVTYGTNGFFLKFDNSGNMGLDSGGGSNNFTTSGTITQAKDTPSNVFATWNPLDNGRTWSGTIGLKNGNTTQDNASDGSPISTLGMTSGKWYAEIKIVNATNTRTVGIIDMASNNSYIGHGSIAEPISYAYNTASQSLWSGTTEAATSVGEGVAGDIISVLVDLDSATKTIKFKRNNVDLSGTTQLTISQSDITWGFVLRCDGGQIMSANFGNGYFGTTAVTSAGTNASDNGIFEYDVPTGYTALSTKGLDS